MKKQFILLFTSILLLYGCGRPVTVGEQSGPKTMSERSEVEEEIKSHILANEYPPYEIDFVLLTSSDEGLNCSVNSSWSKSSSIFLKECYYIIPAIKEVMDSHEYIYNQIDISSQSKYEDIRHLTYITDENINFYDSSASTINQKYTYEQLDTPDSVQEAERENKKNIIKASDSYDINGETFHFSNSVRNDVTGNWRISLIASSKEPTEYAIDYYNTLFGSDDEIHAVINFTLNTTTRISVLQSGILDVTVLEYIDKEEHDAKLLFGGMFLKEYIINIETGEVEEIQ